MPQSDLIDCRIALVLGVEEQGEALSNARETRKRMEASVVNFEIPEDPRIVILALVQSERMYFHIGQCEYGAGC